MADVFSRRKRSDVMSRIRGRGNRATELFLCSLFRKHSVKGWRRHLKLPGTPDFAFPSEKVVIFADGCFWHGCAPCSKGRKPVNNSRYWSDKIEANRRRDRRADRALRSCGWTVIRVWEHALERTPENAISKICQALAS